MREIRVNQLGFPTATSFALLGSTQFGRFSAPDTRYYFSTLSAQSSQLKLLHQQIEGQSFALGDYWD